VKYRDPGTTPEPATTSQLFRSVHLSSYFPGKLELVLAQFIHIMEKQQQRISIINFYIQSTAYRIILINKTVKPTRLVIQGKCRVFEKKTAVLLLCLHNSCQFDGIQHLSIVPSILYHKETLYLHCVKNTRLLD